MAPFEYGAEYSEDNLICVHQYPRSLPRFVEVKFKSVFVVPLVILKQKSRSTIFYEAVHTDVCHFLTKSDSL